MYLLSKTLPILITYFIYIYITYLYLYPINYYLYTYTYPISISHIYLISNNLTFSMYMYTREYTVGT